MKELKKLFSHCQNCFNSKLKQVKNHNHNDVMTNENVKHNGLLCENCGCFHYFDGEYYSFEYLVNCKTDYLFGSNVRMLKSDNEVAKENKLSLTPTPN